MSDLLCPACQSLNPPEAPLCRSCGAPLLAVETSADALPVGATLKNGEYRVGKVLGQGGFGITCLGSQRRLSRPVAIKEFFPSGCRRQGRSVHPGGGIGLDDFRLARDRFLEESKILSRFQHPGIVQIFDGFEENETAYMVMEYLRGRNLAALLFERGGSLPEREALDYVERVAVALEAVHREGLLHRDVKPENIVLTESGEVVLIDFGSARAFAAGKTRRMTSVVTHGYSPLEQYGLQAKFGPFTDVYALGATLYHLLTGEMPPSATDRAAGVELPPIRRFNPDVSEATANAVVMAMRVSVAQRPQSVTEWLELLKAPVPLPAPAPSKSATPSVRHNPKDGAEIVFVPAGEFLMGGDDRMDNEKPAHSVYLDGFWLYRTPVTVAQYRKFCAETHRVMPPAPKWGWRADHPVVNVSWRNAVDYSRWAGARLPTEAEWEKAARGIDGRTYPWGRDFDPAHLRCSRRELGDAGGTAPVDSHPSGAGPCGALDLAGNAWEWTADRYDPGYYGKSPAANPKGPEGWLQLSRVLRGGSWTFAESNFFRAAYRNWDVPANRNPNYGFRCAMNG